MSKFNIRQVVPAEWCATCDVCCRFPEKDSLLAPYFTEDEIVSALKRGIEDSCFPDKAGGKIALIPYKAGYICPAFNPISGQCKIYNVRPLDCKLYPFAVMRDATGKEVVLGMDSKCPFVRDQKGVYILKDISAEMADLLQSPPLLDIIAVNRGLIGPYQEDVIPLVSLKELTDRV